MQEFRSLDDVLDYAVAREEEAARIYSELAETATRPGMREAFAAFAAEEESHRRRLLEVKAGKLPAVTAEEVKALNIADSLAPVAPSGAMTYAEALAMAIRAEKQARELYTNLAALVGTELAAVFRSLAAEEARHQLKFETEYDEVVLEGV